MKFSAPLAFSILLASVGLANAADPAGKKKEPEPPPVATGGFDYAFGVKAQTDYNFRGISQTNRQPGVTAYGELRYDWLYVGIQPWSVNLPTKPAAEVDLYAGIRPVWGPFTFDFGGLWYWYPDNKRQYFIGGVPTTPKDPSFGEIYGKVAYTWQDTVTLGGNVFYAPDWTHTGASGTYVSGTAKIVLPKAYQPTALQSVDFAVSGEFGHYFLGTSKAYLGPTKYRSYNYWNAGISATYKIATLDLRYHQTDLNKAQCYLNSSDPRGNITGRSSWCGAAFIASLSFDITSATFK